MFTVDLTWAYIVVPVALVSILILIKLKQDKVPKGIEHVSAEREKEKEASRSVENTTAEKTAKVKESPKKAIAKAQKSPEPSPEKPKSCPHFLGYLHVKKVPDKTPIPSECYNCSRLLQCLYSPNAIEKVYGNENLTA